MSARGIILSGDLGKLLIEASDAEVAQFGKGQLVGIEALEPKPKKSQMWPHTMYMYGGPGVGGVVHGAWASFSDEGPVPHVGSYVYNAQGVIIGSILDISETSLQVIRL